MYSNIYFFNLSCIFHSRSNNCREKGVRFYFYSSNLITMLKHTLKHCSL